ncbi:MAG: Hsp20/alpha crystallin family protein [Methanocellales archaeon]|nr:Hsp20/alpha crystallin family protein [Methanocellales archaeon]
MVRKWRRSPFDDMLRDLFERIDEMFEEEKPFEAWRPFVFGFSLTRQPGEEPEIREFGNIFPWEEKIEIKERKPLIDTFESDDEIHVIAEMPGIEKKDIRLNATKTTLEIEAETENRRYAEHVDLPAGVDPDSAKATYNNGVLEVTLKRAMLVRKGRPIKID